MKKLLVFIMLIIGMAFSINVKADIPNPNYLGATTISHIMNSSVTLTMETPSKEDFNLHVQKIKEIYYSYNYYAFAGFEEINQSVAAVYNEGYDLVGGAPNIMNLNQNPGAKTEIDQNLYEMLSQAEEIRKSTDGYFDYSIGGLINIWKSYIKEYAYSEIPEDKFQELIEKVEDYQIIKDPIKLEKEGNNYYATIKKGVVIDLGAFAKGYATEKARQYLIKNNIETYLINAGTSSIAVGQKWKGEAYRIALRMPYHVPEVDKYGIITARNSTITTSGDYEQYFEYKQNRYHHIISPKTKRPEKKYHALTIVGKDAGMMDALSTALFSMPKEEALNVLEKLKINGVFFTTQKGDKKTFDNFNNQYSNLYSFELDQDFLKVETKHGGIGRYIILAVYILLVLGFLSGLMIIFKKYGKAIKENAKVKLIRDGLLFVFLLVLIGGGALTYHVWPKPKPENAVVLYQKEPYVQIDFNKKRVIEIKNQIDNYPIINSIDANHYEITMLGDFVEKGKRQEVVIEVDFLENRVRVIKESSPYHYCSRQGWGKYGSIICAPNSVEITFRKIEGFDGAV